VGADAAKIDSLVDMFALQLTLLVVPERIELISDRLLDEVDNHRVPHAVLPQLQVVVLLDGPQQVDDVLLVHFKIADAHLHSQTFTFAVGRNSRIRPKISFMHSGISPMLFFPPCIK
jgi:hypothetical protein